MLLACWDGIGVPPDIRVDNKKADIDAGSDPMLAFALSRVQAGNLKLQDEAESLVNRKQSMVAHFAMIVGRGELDDASGFLEKASASTDGSWFDSQVR
jgi:hypothetical protein